VESTDGAASDEASATANVPRSSIEPTPAVKAAPAVVPTVEPWACPDEDAARKPARTVVSIRRTRVRIIAVVAVGAYWSWACVNWLGVNRRTVSRIDVTPVTVWVTGTLVVISLVSLVAVALVLVALIAVTLVGISRAVLCLY
jgi:hypothetical protein